MVRGHTIFIKHFYALVVLFACAVLLLSRPLTVDALGGQTIITEIMTQSATEQTEEFVEIYNQSSFDIPLKNIQLYYLTAVGNPSVMKLAPDFGENVLLAKSFLLLTRSTWVGMASDATFTTGLNEKGGHIQVRYLGETIDTVGWGDATKAETVAVEPAAKGFSISRRVDPNGRFIDTNNNSLDFYETFPSPIGGGVAESEEIDEPEGPVEVDEDVCLNIDGVQLAIPLGYERSEYGDCLLPYSTCNVVIGEISAQPNFESKEYIEVYNNTAEAASLEHCKYSINGGSEKVFPEYQLEAGQHHSVTFNSGAIRNSAGSVLLINSDGKKVNYEYLTSSLGQSTNFSALAIPSLTDHPTPSAENIENAPGGSGGSTSSTGQLADCGPGKYRNPETNRCRNIEAASSSLVPCAADQERNPETNRCRKIASAVSGTSLESVGQPAAIGSFPYKVPLIGLLGAFLVGYGGYEYRTEIYNFMQRLRDRRIRGRPPG